MTRLDLVDEHWQAAQDRAAVGDGRAGSGGDADLGDGEPDPRWVAELDFYAALRASGQPQAGSDPEADTRLIEAALRIAFRAGDAAPAAANESDAPVVVRPGFGRTRRRVVVLVAVIAAAALLWLGWPSSPDLSVSSGVWIAERGGTRGRGEVLPLAVWLVADGDGCLSVDGDTVCAQAGARLRVVDPTRRGIELDGGALRVESGRWTVQTAGHLHMLSAGDTLDVETALSATRAVANAGEPQLDAGAVAPTPAIEPLPPQDPPLGANPADEPVRQRSVKSDTPSDDAATLLRRARSLRGQGEPKQADATYAGLLRRFPKSPEAGPARVSLGQIRLDAGRPKSALALFETYLRRGGPLAEEANWGKIQALDRLGRTAALRDAVTQFEAKFPRSVYRAQAKERLTP